MSVDETYLRTLADDAFDRLHRAVLAESRRRRIEQFPDAVRALLLDADLGNPQFLAEEVREISFGTSYENDLGTYLVAEDWRIELYDGEEITVHVIPENEHPHHYEIEALLKGVLDAFGSEMYDRIRANVSRLVVCYPAKVITIEGN